MAAPEVPLPLSSESAIALVVANLVPLVGVLFFGWNLADLMVLYWVESGVVAFYTVLKIAIVGRLGGPRGGAVLRRSLRRLHGRPFPADLRLFLQESDAGWLPARARNCLPSSSPSGRRLPRSSSATACRSSRTSLDREYEGATVSGLMTAPYNRIMVMHLTLIFGGWIILLMGMPTGALVILLVSENSGRSPGAPQGDTGGMHAGDRRSRGSRGSRGEP